MILALLMLSLMGQGSARGSEYSERPPQRKKVEITVPSLTVEGLKDFAGKEIQFFYVAAREAGLGVDGQALLVRQVATAPIVLEVSEDGTVELPEAKIRQVRSTLVNYVFAAVPSDPERPFFIKNPNGKLAIDPRLKKDQKLKKAQTVADWTYFISVEELKELKDEAGEGGGAKLDLSSTLKRSKKSDSKDE